SVDIMICAFFFFFSSRRRHTRFSRDWSSDVCSSDLRIVTEQIGQSEPACQIERGLYGLPHAGSGLVHAQQFHRDPVRLPTDTGRSEERRVGKECRSRGPPGGWKKKRRRQRSRIARTR